MDIEKLIERLKWWSEGCDRTNKGCQVSRILQAAATAISTLQAENAQLRAKLEQTKREKETAVADLRQMCIGGNTCAFCVKDQNCNKKGPNRKTVEPCWQWRGLEEG